jgi:anti-sigma regulatory factor (Ser/Thr protein kinase)
MTHDNCLTRTEWDVSFAAEPREVPALRRIMRLHLLHWGLPNVIETAQLCVTELVSNVIKHVGVGAPTTLAVSMNGTNLRLEVRDPVADELPTVVPFAAEAEGGRGLAIIDTVAENWGVCLTSSGKTTWCELATALTSPHGHVRDHRVQRADALLVSYSAEVARFTGAGDSLVSQATEGAVNLIADLLHWLEAHGLDPEAELDRALASFEAVSAARR